MNFIKKLYWLLWILGIIGIAYGMILLKDAPIGAINATEFTFNGQTIKTEYTDTNIDEDLIIRTDKDHYGGWDNAEVYFSIENTSKNTETTDIQFYFAGYETIAEINELQKDVPYNITVQDYGKKDYSCATDWIATTTNMMGKETINYLCDKEIKNCNSVNKTICTVDNDLIGSHQETKYKDQWNGLVLDNSITMKQTLPDKFKTKKKVSYNIPAGEIKFFKAIIKFAPKSEGQFLIYTEGVSNRGNLK